jgi:hypothetical protein
MYGVRYNIWHVGEQSLRVIYPAGLCKQTPESGGGDERTNLGGTVIRTAYTYRPPPTNIIYNILFIGTRYKRALLHRRIYDGHGKAQ